MGYGYTKCNKKQVEQDIKNYLRERYKEKGRNFHFRTRHLPFDYCNGLMGKIINTSLTDIAEIKNHNSRTYIWRTTFERSD